MGKCLVVRKGIITFVLNLMEKRKFKMNTMNVSAEVIRQLGYIADDEDCMKKVLRAIRNIVATHQVTMESTYQPRSKEELIADFDEAAKDVRLYREGKKEFRPAEELIDEL